MFLAVLKLDLFIPDSLSLKSKRFVIKSLKDRIRAHFNVSVSEIDHHDLWQRASLAVAAVSNERRSLTALMQKVANLVENEPRVQLLDYTIEEY